MALRCKACKSADNPKISCAKFGPGDQSIDFLRGSSLHLLRKVILSIVQTMIVLVQPLVAFAAIAAADGLAVESSYILADSIGYGLHLDNLEAKLQAKLGGTSQISYDGSRSITTPGSQIKKSALQSVDLDKEYIATAGVIIIILGMEQQETSFADSQEELIRKLKGIAPNARYYWVDIAATISTSVAGWNARNRIIYDNAGKLDYTVISRYKAIFGADADPLNIPPGRNFPGWISEPGYSGPGNIHGLYSELSRAIIETLYASDTRAPCGKAANRSSYIIGDSIAYGLYRDRLGVKLQEMLGGTSRINYDGGRSITTPGIQIKMSALDSIDIDREFISKTNVIIIILGTNQVEDSFAESQKVLLQKLKNIAPYAKYYWVDIGATISNDVAGWNARNKIIYDNAGKLGYTVISRYKAIFGPKVDPLNITPGMNFPGLTDEVGYVSPGNVHGAIRPLTQAILDVISGVSPGNGGAAYSAACTGGT